MSRFSVKKPYTVFVAVVICLILGVVSFTRMSTDLLPEFSLPYVVVVTTYPGASPDKIESTVTEPLESGLGTVNGVENVTSTSNENYCTVMLVRRGYKHGQRHGKTVQCIRSDYTAGWRRKADDHGSVHGYASGHLCQRGL